MGSWVKRLQFESLDGCVSEPKAQGGIRIVSFNTLADQYIHYQWQARPSASQKIFNRCRRHHLLGRIFQQFVDLQVDFICLQEVDFKIAREILVDANNYTRLLTPTGYGRGDARLPSTGHGQRSTRPDACCIFYSPDWILVGKEEIVNLDDLAGDNPTSKFAKSFSRGNFGIIACFQHRLDDSKKVIVSNAHLFWDPAYEHVKLCQAHYLCLRIDTILEQHRQNGDNIPVIFCGDLNSQPGGLVHNYLAFGEVNLDTEISKKLKRTPHIHGNGWNRKAQAWLSQNSLECPLRTQLFDSAYAKQDNGGHIDGEAIGFTNSTPDFVGVIDYIFCPGVSMGQTKTLSFPTSTSPKNRPILPSANWPSDHWAIGAELFFD